eukprot:CAMPEP_0194695694 /NCGR_PEP_ID=MMETSP0295-20121207/22148_1 /TAXON_ID=39354 /ORGANISM="Heterosigma akashiwo, Strain CCMP2393" /LENGTH=200 /DNA_ID=CAMNT_0039587553 /DNA_START=1 /DNA_END=603 /DNA_ORIENTATION=-
MPTMCRITNVENVAVGNNHTLFLTSNGLVHSCGSNKYGQLGQPDVSWEGTAVPGPVAGLPPPALCSGGVRGVAAGPLCSVALTRSGDVYFWGRSAALHNSRQQGGLKKDHDGDGSISQNHHDDSDNDDDYLSYFLEEADEEGEDIQAESDPILLTEEVCDGSRRWGRWWGCAATPARSHSRRAAGGSMCWEERMVIWRDL